MKNVRKMVFLSILVAIGLGLSVMESVIPLPIMVPGAKLGLSNMVVLVTLVVFGLKEGIMVSLLKSIVLMLVTGSVSSFMYSFSGALLSSLAMSIGYKYFSNIFSLIGISILGALFHNLAQITLASFMMNNMRIYTYLPFLMLTSLFTGYFVGITSTYIIKNLKSNFKLIFDDKI